MDRLSRLFGNLPGLGNAQTAPDTPVVDTAEKVQISSLALLKMLKHGALAKGPIPLFPRVVTAL
jgi:26S proteasome regulatory subunit N11